MNIFITIFLLVFSLHFIYGADNYKVGDKLYVWANSGLNLRTSPTKNSKLIVTLEPGSQLTVIGITKREFVYKLYTSSKHEKHPYLLYGNWVKVSTGSGNKGFVFDSFLLDIPIEPNLDFESYLESISYKVDTSNLKNQYTEPYIKGYCKYDITYEIYRTEKYGEERISLPNFSLEEGIIFLEFFMNYEESTENNKHFRLMKNWENEIIFSNYKHVTINHKGNITKISLFVSC